MDIKIFPDILKRFDIFRLNSSFFCCITLVHKGVNNNSDKQVEENLHHNDNV